MANFTELGPFCTAATTFWRNNTLPGGERVVLVDAMSQDLRVTLRNLTLANALRRITPARLVVLTGADKDWRQTLWTSFDAGVLSEISMAYGAAEVIDVHTLVDSLTGDRPPHEFVVAGTTFRTGELRTEVGPATLDEIVQASAARVYQLPRISPEERGSARYRKLRARGERFSQLYDALFAEFDPVALVTGSVDYIHWGLAVESAQRAGVPVVHVQSTGTFKAYASFPDNERGDLTYRGELTKQIGQYFEEHVWSRRKELQRAAELTTWRNKFNLGRPSWWRGRGDISAMEIRTNAERAELRTHAMQRWGLDPDKPVVGVFVPALSDALDTNVEVFADAAAWLEQTAAYAARHDEVNWLFLDHPSQPQFDRTGFFASVAARHADASQLCFAGSWDLSKNVMWSLVDLGVTVRGSIGNELPAYGIACVQAGWSEWSELGFGPLATDADDYWRILDESLTGLVAGEPLITDQQIEKARLWMWFYRAATDVPSVFVQQWELGEADALFHTLRMTMQYVEADDDPVFEAVRRMWTGKQPFLTRFDLPALEPGALEVSTGEPGETAVVDPDANDAHPRLLTAYDRRIPAITVPGTLARGDDPALHLVDGLARGVSVLGRFGRSPALFGVEVDPGEAGPAIPVTLTVTLDDVSLTWWQQRAPGAPETADPTAARVLLVRALGKTRSAVVLDRGGKGAGRSRPVAFEVDRAEIERAGLLTVELVDASPSLPVWAARSVEPYGVIGVVVTGLALDEPVAVVADGAAYNGLFVVDDGSAEQVIRPVMTKPPAGEPAVVEPAAPAASANVPARPGDGPTVQPSTHTLPPPEPRTRGGRWAARWKTRMQAEARINGAAGTGEARRDRPVKPVPALDAAAEPKKKSRQPVRRDVLGELIADLLRDKRMIVRAVSLIDGTEQRLAVRAGAGNDLAVTLDPALQRPVLLRLDIAEDELATAPELTRYGVVWHVVTPHPDESGAAGDQE